MNLFITTCQEPKILLVLWLSGTKMLIFVLFVVGQVWSTCLKVVEE